MIVPRIQLEIHVIDISRYDIFDTQSPTDDQGIYCNHHNCSICQSKSRDIDTSTKPNETSLFKCTKSNSNKYGFTTSSSVVLLTLSIIIEYDIVSHCHSSPNKDARGKVISYQQRWLAWSITGDELGKSGYAKAKRLLRPRWHKNDINNSIN